MTRFRDRREAGRKLAKALAAHHADTDLLVLALPRGGVPVALEVALALGAPLDVFIVRKLGAPGQEELAMGALASGGIRVLNEGVLASLAVPGQALEEATRREAAELARRERLYREGRPPLEVEGRTVILVDDGVATGATMSAAIQALRARKPKAIVVAVPVAPPSTFHALKAKADEVVCLATPEPFFAIGAFYDVFDQTSDTEVRQGLSRASAATAEAGKAT